MRRGNPQFTNPEQLGPGPFSETSFERVVEELRLSPSEYATSREATRLGVSEQRP